MSSQPNRLMGSLRGRTPAAKVLPVEAAAWNGARPSGHRLAVFPHPQCREDKAPALDPLEAREIHIVHYDDPRRQADFRADRVGQCRCGSNRHIIVRESLYEFPLSI